MNIMIMLAASLLPAVLLLLYNVIVTKNEYTSLL